MHGGGVNKLETRVQILELFQGVNLVLLTKTWHFPSQHLPHVEGFDSLTVARIVQLGKTKVIKHSEGIVVYFRRHLSPNLSQWKERSHDSYLWLWVSKGATPDLFACVVYTAPVSSKHKSVSLFQNLAADVEVQILGGIVLLGGDFNARIATLPDTIDTCNLCELLHAPDLAEAEQPNVMAKRQNRDIGVGGWGHKLLDLCYDARLLILNGWTFGDELGEFICLTNGGHNIVDYIVGSPVVWQVATYFKVIIDDTRYRAMGEDSNHRPLHLRLSIDCSFVEP
jgi:hypothetical protein